MSNTAKVDEYLRANDKPTPSFDVDAPVDFGIPEDELDIEDARRAAIEAALELQDLLQGATALLRPPINGTSLQAIYKYDIPSKVPIHGRISFGDLESACGLPESDLRRILRYAIVTHRVFCEPRKGFVAHTAASRQLAENPRAFDMLGLSFDQDWQSWPAYTVEAMQRFPDREPNQTGHALAHNTTDNTFDYLKNHPEVARRFYSAIGTLEPSGRFADFLKKGFDWASLGKGTVVDVGGAKGGVAIQLAEAFADLDFVVQDLPMVVHGAAALLPQNLAGRIKVETYDFSEEDGTKIIINDSLIPAPGTLGLLEERNVRSFDLLMMTLFNAQEREEDDWHRLLREADARFRLLEAKGPDVGTMGLIIAIWEDPVPGNI
ncbi:MAG: hypothetical protein M1820_002141 [Bogoriella megaspora]|nr:MAG: hypothetical protein M1820_002141 [Bogoriella megaspora]